MLSLEQQALWDKMEMDALSSPSGEQSEEQAEEAAVAEFQMMLALEGLPAMSHDEIVEERARR